MTANTAAKPAATDNTEFDFLKTKDEAGQFLVIIDQLIGSIFQTNFNFEANLDKLLTHEQKEQVLALARAKGVNLSQVSQIKSFLQNLTKEINSLPVIDLTMAYSPKEKSLEDIHNWFYINFKKSVLLNINVDKKIIGGAVVAFKGKYYDYSVLKRLDQQLKPQEGAAEVKK